jgi:hypothetical protein
MVQTRRIDANLVVASVRTIFSDAGRRGSRHGGGGKTGGFSAPGGVRTKFRLLSIERAQPGGPTLFTDLPLASRPRRRAQS